MGYDPKAAKGGAQMGYDPKAGMGGAQMGYDPKAGMGGAQVGYDPKAGMGGGAFSPGQHVQAQWGGGGFYGAKVLAFNGAQYQVAWDDGTAPTWVAVNLVKPG
jgi:hypothetical protein